MARYTYICENNECNYKHGFSMNFVPVESADKVCNVCDKPLKVAETSVAAARQSNSAAIVSGVGEINSRLSGDWKDLMKSISRGSPNNNMPDYK